MVWKEGDSKLFTMLCKYFPPLALRLFTFLFAWSDIPFFTNAASKTTDPCATSRRRISSPCYAMATEPYRTGFHWRLASGSSAGMKREKCLLVISGMSILMIKVDF